MAAAVSASPPRSPSNMYVLPVRDLPLSMDQPAAKASESAEATVSSLAKRVSAYLARVVGALADYEDQLLFEDGFFAREEHFEAQIDNLRREFEQNRKAQALFARADAVGLLVAQLIARQPAATAASADLHSRRQQQFVFAASVLLTSSTAVATLKAHPQLIERLWAFVERPAPLDSVQLQYWCRVAGGLLLAAPESAPPRASAGDTPAEPEGAAALTKKLLPLLLSHLYSDSVCLLVKCLLGLPCASGIPSADAVASGTSASVLPIRAVLQGDHSLLTRCVRCTLTGDELQGAANAAELLSTLCTALPDRTDALEVCRAFLSAFSPLLTELLDAALLPGHASGKAAVGALHVASAALKLEHRLTALDDEQLAWIPTGMLDSGSGLCGSTGSAAAASSPRPFARLLLPRLGLLRERLIASRSLVQLEVASLVSTLLEVAPAWMHAPLHESRLLESIAHLYLKRDVNGGGQQDFLRQLLLGGLRVAFRAQVPAWHESLVLRSELPRAMLRAMAAPSSSAAVEGARGLAREHVCLLHAELVQAAEASPSLAELLERRSPTSWASLSAAIAGTISASELCPTPPSRPSPPTELPSPEMAAPAELLELDDDDDDSFETMLAASRRATELIECHEDDDDDDDDEYVSAGESPSAEEERAPTDAHPQLITDVENMDPNSPPQSPAARGLKLRGSPAPASPRTPVPPRATTAEPHTPPPMSTPPSIGISITDAVARERPQPGTPRPDEPAPRAHVGTPRPEGKHVGTPRPESKHVGTPRPEMDEGGKTLNFVESASLRTSQDFSRDTPQPKVVRRAYLHRRAKDQSPFGNLGETPPPFGRADSLELYARDSPRAANSAGSSGSSDASEAAEVARDPFSSDAGAGSAEIGASDGLEAAPEDAAVHQLRSSVRTLCF